LLLRSFKNAAKLRLMYVLDVRAEQEAIMFGNAVIYAKTTAGRHPRGMHELNATSAGNLFPTLLDNPYKSALSLTCMGV
jgi:hypothetical protein